MLAYAGKPHAKSRGCTWATYRTMLSLIEDQQKLIAELYYYDDVEHVRARIKQFVENSDKARLIHRTKKAKKRLLNARGNGIGRGNDISPA